MKRILVTGAIMLSLVAGLAGARERWRRYDTKTATSTTNTLWVPSYRGTTFRPTMLRLHVLSYSWGTVGQYEITIYFPLDKGPNSATDSMVVSLPIYMKQLTSGTAGVSEIKRYYGPVSDTLRVQTNAYVSTHTEAMQ